MAEKRVAPRIDVGLPVTIYESVNVTKIAEGTIFNLSIKGVALHTSIYVGVGSELYLEFKLKKYETLEIFVKSKVEVRWQKPEEDIVNYGVEFVKLDTLSKSRIRKYVEAELNKRKYIL